jgi:Kef-type K+ transport system membrane component KefB
MEPRTLSYDEERTVEGPWGIAVVWLGLARIASLLSIRFKMSAARVEILTGIAAGNLSAADEIIRKLKSVELLMRCP